MKKLMLLMATVLAGLTSCSKDELPSGTGEETTVTITAQMPTNGIETRAIGDGTTVNRCIMEVYTNGQFYKRIVAKIDGKTAKFDLRLVSSQTYDFLFWADKVESNLTDEEIETDNLYSTNLDGLGLKNVTIKDVNYAGNNEERDAFFAHETVKVDATTTLDVKLKRPFGQLNVKTGLKDVTPSLTPDKVVIYYSTKLYTKFDIMTGEVSDDVQMQWSAVADVVGEVAGTDPKTLDLAVDYLFAPKTGQHLIDFKMSFYNGTTEITSNDNFRSIPIQRNYKTNVSGELLTKQGTIKVEVKPEFDSPSIDREVVDVDAVSVEEINNALASKDAQDNGKAVQVNMQETITSASTIVIPSATKEETPSVTFNFTKDISEVVTIQEEANATFAGEVYISAPKMSTGGSFEINMPNSTVYINGVKVDNMSSKTAENTLVIDAKSEIGTLTVNGGNVAIYGKVTTIVRGENNKGEMIVNVYPGGTLENDPTDNTIIVNRLHAGIRNFETGELYPSLKEAVNAVEDGGTIELIGDKFDLTADITKLNNNQEDYFLMIDKNITIRGVGNVTLVPQGVVTSGAGWAQSTIRVRGENVVANFENITFLPHIYTLGGAGLANKTIEVDGGAKVNVKNCTFAINNEIEGYKPTSGGALFFNNAASGSVENCTFKTSALTASSLRNETITVKNSTFDNSFINTNSWDNTFVPANSTFKMFVSGCSFKNIENLGRPAVRAFYGTITLENNTFPTANGIYCVADGNGTMIVNGAQQLHTVATVQELKAALANNKTIGVILNSDLDFGTSEFAITRAGYIFDGNGHTLTGAVSAHNTVMIGANDVEFRNATITNTVKNGMTVYCVTGVKLDRITFLNNAKLGLVVNGAEVIASNITATGTKGAGSINLGQGSGVTAMPKLTLSGTNNIEKGTTYQIYADFLSGTDKSGCLEASDWTISSNPAAFNVFWTK